MGLGVIGAALGTVLSQTISVVISLFIIVRQKMELNCYYMCGCVCVA
jgi:hypothetical protein